MCSEDVHDQTEDVRGSHSCRAEDCCVCFEPVEGCFGEEVTIFSVYPPLGLDDSHGGPCGSD